MPGAGNLAAQPVEHKVAGAQNGRLVRHLRPAHEGCDTGRELSESEGLAKVVVGPGIEPLDPVVHEIHGSQKDHGGLVLRPPKGLQQGDPVKPRQHPIEDHHIVTADGGLHETLMSGHDLVNGMPFATKAVGDVVVRSLIVLDHQQFHVLSSFGRSE